MLSCFHHQVLIAMFRFCEILAVMETQLLSPSAGGLTCLCSVSEALHALRSKPFPPVKTPAELLSESRHNQHCQPTF